MNAGMLSYPREGVGHWSQLALSVWSKIEKMVTTCPDFHKRSTIRDEPRQTNIKLMSLNSSQPSRLIQSLANNSTHQITSCWCQLGQKYQCGGEAGRKELPEERLMVIYSRSASPSASSSKSGDRVAKNSSRKTTPGNVEGNFRKWLVGSRLEEQHLSTAGEVVTRWRNGPQLGGDVGVESDTRRQTVSSHGEINQTGFPATLLSQLDLPTGPQPAYSRAELTSLTCDLLACVQQQQQQHCACVDWQAAVRAQRSHRGQNQTSQNSNLSLTTNFQTGRIKKNNNYSHKNQFWHISILSKWNESSK